MAKAATPTRSPAVIASAPGSGTVVRRGMLASETRTASPRCRAGHRDPPHPEWRARGSAAPPIPCAALRAFQVLALARTTRVLGQSPTLVILDGASAPIQDLEGTANRRLGHSANPGGGASGLRGPGFRQDDRGLGAARRPHQGSSSLSQ